MKTIQKTITIGAIAAGCFAIAVATDQPVSGEAEISSVSNIGAEALWRQDCAGCHGRDGKGQTRAGRRAGAPDMTDAAFHESVPDEQAFKSLKEGKLNEQGAELKKPFGDDLTDEEIKALIEYLREQFDPKHPRDLSEAALRKAK